MRPARRRVLAWGSRRRSAAGYQTGELLVWSGRKRRVVQRRLGLDVGGTANQSIGRRAREPTALVATSRQELRRDGSVTTNAAAPTASAASTTRRPGRGRGPIPRRVPSNGQVRHWWRRMSTRCRVVSRFEIWLVAPTASLAGRDRPRLGLWLGRQGGPGSLPFPSGMRRLASSPILEGGADRERTREAVRLLVGARARRRNQLRVAAVAVIGARGARFPVVLERDERAGRSDVRAGEPSLAHRRDDTRQRVVTRAQAPPSRAFDSPARRSDTSGTERRRSSRLQCPKESQCLD